MNKKNLIITITSLAVVCLISAVAFMNNNKTEEDTSLSVDTNVSVDGDTNKELDWVQIQKEDLPYEAEGDLYIPVKEVVVDLDEDLSDLTVDTLKEVLEVDETGFVTGVTQGNNVVTIVPEEVASHFDSDYSDIIDESNMTIPADILAMMDIPANLSTEAELAAAEAQANSTNGSELVWGSN